MRCPCGETPASTGTSRAAWDTRSSGDQARRHARWRRHAWHNSHCRQCWQRWERPRNGRERRHKKCTSQSRSCPELRRMLWVASPWRLWCPRCSQRALSTAPSDVVRSRPGRNRTGCCLLRRLRYLCMDKQQRTLALTERVSRTEQMFSPKHKTKPKTQRDPNSEFNSTLFSKKISKKKIFET